MTDGGALAAMLRARSIALVGASARPDSLGARMIDEVTRSAGDRRIHLVNPRYAEIGDQPCVPSLTDIDERLDLVLLGVGDAALEGELAAAARLGAHGAVVFGSARGSGLRESLRSIAVDAGMALCGGGCMGFVNNEDGLRATGYLERADLPRGPIALVTHSGSVFSTMLRTRRALGFSLAVSSGQELVTTAADYLEYVLDQTATRLIALVLETVRDAPRLVAQLRRAADRDVPVVVLPVGSSAVGSAMVTAHSGALAGARATWEALADGTGALLVDDLAELTDTLELLAIGRRARHGIGIATVHDSGAERSLVADLAAELDLAFAPLAPTTLSRLTDVLEPGLVAENPLDLWGTGAGTFDLFTESLQAMAADPSVSVAALAVDLVEEYDGDTSYPDAALAAHAATDAPIVVLANLSSAVDVAAASRLRAAGIPVLEGTRSGLVALRNLLASTRTPVSADDVAIDDVRREQWRGRLAGARPLDGVESFALLDAYGIPTVAVRAAHDEAEVAEAADEVGYPVVLKTDAEGISHRSDVNGVVVGLADQAAVLAAYRELSARLGPRVLICAAATVGLELSVGIARDVHLGPIVVVAAGGVLAELLSDRAVLLPPVSRERAGAALDRLRIRPLLDGWRGGSAIDATQIVDTIVAVGRLAVELGDWVAELDVNPLIAAPDGAWAVDVLVVPAR